MRSMCSENYLLWVRNVSVRDPSERFSGYSVLCVKAKSARALRIRCKPEFCCKGAELGFVVLEGTVEVLGTGLANASWLAAR